MKTNLEKLFLFIISGALSLFAVFFILEFTYSQSHAAELHNNYLQPDIELGWTPIPKLRLPNHPFGKITTNDQGFRSPEIIPQKKKIIFVGDSVTWGYGVTDEQTMSYFLSQKMAGTDYQVVNLGVPGYGTDQEYLRLEKTLVKLPNIKKSILVLFSNDISDVGTNVLYDSRKPLFFYAANHSTLSFSPISKWDLRYGISQSHFLKKCLHHNPRADKFFGIIAGDRSLSQFEAEKIFMALLEKMLTLLNNRGIGSLIVLSPGNGDLQKKSPSFLRIESLLNKGRIPYLNLYDELKNQNTGTLFRDEAHYSAEGNKIVANILYQHLFKHSEEIK